MKTRVRQENPGEFRTFALVLAIMVLAAASLACAATNTAGGQQQTAERSDAQSCSALGEVNITLGEFSEDTTTESDGSLSGQECYYSYRVEITGNAAVILVYFDHYSYGSNPPPNDYEFGWNKTAPLEPGKSWELRSSLTSYPKQPLYLDMISDLAVIYASPECAWLVENGIDTEILKIETDQPLQPPCQLISIDSEPDALPDLLLGLNSE